MIISLIVFMNNWVSWASAELKSPNTFPRKKSVLPIVRFPRQIEAAVLTLSVGALKKLEILSTI
jgi:hypothetical protein